MVTVDTSKDVSQPKLILSRQEGTRLLAQDQQTVLGRYSRAYDFVPTLTASLVDVFNNLKQEYGKTAVQKVLSQLSGDGLITCKTYGKQSVFVSKQDELEVVSADELKRMDEEIERAKKNVQEAKQATGSLQARLATLESTMTLEEVMDKVKTLSAKNEKMTARLKSLREQHGSAKLDPTECVRVDEQYEAMRKLWRTRRRLCKTIIDMMTESGAMKPKELMEMVGVETDEDAGHIYEREWKAYMPEDA